MSQDIPREKQLPLSSLPDTICLPPESTPTVTLDARIIEVTKQKKKINFIEIKDSEEEEQKPVKVVKIKEKRPFPQSTKPKKTIIRCMLCRQPGKKSTMKACLGCKAFTHISCLQQEGQQVIRYLCRKCRHNREENNLTKKGEKGGERGQQRLTVKRLQKQKKREQQQKKLGQFQDRYPYYFQEDKVRFPIEDKLLFIYRDLFDVNEISKPKPIPHPLIPPAQLADLLQIQNFFSTFRDELVGFGTLPSEIKKNIFFISMGSRGYDGVFCCLLQCLLNVYLSDIIDKNKTDNVRILNDHPFFTLMIHLNDNQQLTQEVLVKTSKEIMRYLGTIPSMKKAFEELKFSDDLTLSQKVKLIVGLIRGLSQIDQFHDLVSIKSQKMQLLTKERTELIAQLKVDEAQSLSNNEKLKDLNLMSKELEVSQEGVTRLLTKQLDKHKKKMQKLSNQQQKSEESIKEIKNKIAQIGRAMPFITSQIFYLGNDRNQSQYFFYMRQPNRIYVKLRSYLMDKNEYFYLYQSKQSIAQMVKCLNTKGIKQRHLYQNIQSLIKQQIITNNITQQQASNIIIEEDKYHDITFEHIQTMIKQTEETFNTYLVIKQYQWAPPSVRQMFMEQLMTITDLHVLKENLRSLQQSFLFAQYANPETPQKRLDESDDENRGEIRQGRKKVPIRIWGINSQKTKKYWVQYLQQCIDVIGVWICAYIFKNNVEKYVKKKMEAYYEQQIKQQRYRTRQNGHNHRGRPPLRRIVDKSDRYEKYQKYQKYEKNDKSEKNDKIDKKYKVEDSEQSEEVVECRRPNLRTRKHKKMNIDSEIENQYEQEQVSEQSSNEDCCEICGQYGQMICCDTCPKVYHTECLKIKDVPEGEWSCFKCLERMSNERQTRSRVKKVGKFM